MVQEDDKARASQAWLSCEPLFTNTQDGTLNWLVHPVTLLEVAQQPAKQSWIVSVYRLRADAHDVAQDVRLREQAAVAVGRDAGREGIGPSAEGKDDRHG